MSGDSLLEGNTPVFIDKFFLNPGSRFWSFVYWVLEIQVAQLGSGTAILDFGAACCHKIPQISIPPAPFHGSLPNHPVKMVAAHTSARAHKGRQLEGRDLRH